MNPKYFEHIVVYLSVLVVCVLIGALARMIAVGAGVDEFTANIVFWSVTALGVIVYAALAIFIEGLFAATLRKFFPKKETPKTTENTPIPAKSLEEIRTEQQQLIDDKKRAKRDSAVEYTRKEFAPYVSDEDLALLCRSVELYADQLPLSDIQPIRVKTLTTLDLYHFGWNIWKHLNVSKQDDIALFLKLVFAHNLKDVEPDSIKSHLKDEPKKGRILVRERLPINLL